MKISSYLILISMFLCPFAQAEFSCNYDCLVGSKHRDIDNDRIEYYTTHKASRKKYSTVFTLTEEILDKKNQMDRIKLIDEDVRKNCLENVKQSILDGKIKFDINYDNAIIYAHRPGYTGNTCTYLRKTHGSQKYVQDQSKPNEEFNHFCSNEEIMPIVPPHEFKFEYGVNYNEKDLIRVPFSVGAYCVEKGVALVEKALASQSSQATSAANSSKESKTTSKK